MESPLRICRQISAEEHVASAWKSDVDGVRILALHGFTGSGLDWSPVAARLGRRQTSQLLIRYAAFCSHGRR